MAQGTIKKLIADKGFGFIDGEHGDLFFHHSAIDGATIETLEVGQEVTYEEGEKDTAHAGAKSRQRAGMQAHQKRTSRLSRMNSRLKMKQSSRQHHRFAFYQNFNNSIDKISVTN